MTPLETYHLHNLAAARYGTVSDALGGADRQDEVARAVAVEAAILAAPEARGVAVAPEAVDAALSAWRGEHPGCPLDDRALRDFLGRDLAVQAVLAAVAVPAVAEAEVRAFYDAEPARFRRPERREVRHILVTVNPDFADNREDRARERIDDLARKLADGADFSALARRHSECPTAMDGGRVGAVAAGRLYPELDRLAFALAEGAWGGPVRTEMGWHLVACDRILAAGTVPYEGAREEIRTLLSARRRRLAQAAWVRALAGCG